MLFLWKPNLSRASSIRNMNIHARFQRDRLEKIILNAPRVRRLTIFSRNSNDEKRKKIHIHVVERYRGPGVPCHHHQHWEVPRRTGNVLVIFFFPIEKSR